jgi:excisionase family DNA binding protein
MAERSKAKRGAVALPATAPAATVSRLAFKVGEAAESIGMSKRYLQDQIKAGNLRTKRVGRRVLVPVDALNEFLAAK